MSIRFSARKLLLNLFLTTALASSAQGSRYFVKAPADLGTATSSTADGKTWATAIGLDAALMKAKAGDVVFVKGYTQAEAKDNTYYYTVPEGKDAFLLPSGVRMYGGFAGTESESTLEAMYTRLDDPQNDNIRQCVGSNLSRLTRRSVITADRNGDDAPSTSQLLFPQNATRRDNAPHAITVDIAPTAANPNANNEPTVLNGFFITGGNASGTSASDVAAGRAYGGGIYVTAKGAGTDARAKDR